jgi:hypothetical protein
LNSPSVSLKFAERQFEITPKALANLSPGFERSENPGGNTYQKRETLKGFAARGTLSGFNVHFSLAYPGFSRCSNPGLKLANAFGVILN